MVIEGVHTTIPADLAILRHPDFSAVTHSTKWVEETLDLSGMVSTTGGTATNDEGLVERATTIEVNGKRFDVKMWVPEFASGPVKKSNKPTRGSGGSGGSANSGEVAAPMQGTIVKVSVEVGQEVAVGDSVVVLEAMKMENQITAEKAGKVTKVNVKVGDKVGSGDILVVIE
jgi:acetyl-CoA/propionyl-CoA carboxylase biotin carboxyl carrier protein